MHKRYIDGCLSHTPQLGTWPTTQGCALAGNQIVNLLVPKMALNVLSHTSQGYKGLFIFICLISSLKQLCEVCKTHFTRKEMEGQTS